MSERDLLEAAERVASIAIGAASTHAERVLELETELSTLREALQQREEQLRRALDENRSLAEEADIGPRWHQEFDRLRTRDEIATAHINRISEQLKRLAAVIGKDSCDEGELVDEVLRRLSQDEPAACAACGGIGVDRCPHCEAVTCGKCSVCEHSPVLTYSGACALLTQYAIALQDRQCCGDEMQPAYMAALKACTDAMGVQPEKTGSGRLQSDIFGAEFRTEQPDSPSVIGADLPPIPTEAVGRRRAYITWLCKVFGHRPKWEPCPWPSTDSWGAKQYARRCRRCHVWFLRASESDGGSP